MSNPASHTVGLEATDALVRAWVERACGLDPAARFDRFERAFVAVWERARLPLGGITLVAGLDRVLVHAKAMFPVLVPVTVDGSGLPFAGLRATVRQRNQEELDEIFRFLFVEFFTLLGSLTGELITPALHATLRDTDGDARPELSQRANEERKP